MGDPGPSARPGSTGPGPTDPSAPVPRDTEETRSSAAPGASASTTASALWTRLATTTTADLRVTTPVVRMRSVRRGTTEPSAPVPQDMSETLSRPAGCQGELSLTWSDSPDLGVTSTLTSLSSPNISQSWLDNYCIVNQLNFSTAVT